VGSGRRAAHRVTGRSRRWTAPLLLPAVALLCATGLVYRATSAAFTLSTSNSSSWSAGTVTIGNGAVGTLFNPTGLKPNDTAFRCIKVTYTGSLTANVRFYVPATYAGNLAPYLTVAVYEGSTGNNADCSDFDAAPTTLIAATPLGSFSARDFGSGVSLWQPAGGVTTSRTYKIVWTLVDDNNAQGQSLTNVAFTWEAQNT
jgi:hypothetical protein